ncbi:RlmE family RNA methyltransferase [bacterium]|nr:RlmE family RNA methyltransferase [bacterium]
MVLFNPDDFYRKRAKEEGYPARSVYKLKEIEERYSLCKEGDKVLDLGCAPGSWLLYISKKVGSRGKVVGVDIEDIRIQKPKNVVFIKKDIRDLKSSDLSITNFDAVLSDLAPSTSGIKSLDAARSLELAQLAFEKSKLLLSKGGKFLYKVFEGEGLEGFIRTLREHFRTVKKFRPRATSKGSREIYIIGIYNLFEK